MTDDLARLRGQADRATGRRVLVDRDALQRLISRAGATDLDDLTDPRPLDPHRLARAAWATAPTWPAEHGDWDTADPAVTGEVLQAAERALRWLGDHPDAR